MSIKDMQISEEISAIEALKRLDATAKRVLFLVRDEKLVAALTDGDVRRFLISGGSLETPVKEMANYNPKFIRVSDYEPGLAQWIMRSFHIESIPLLDDEGKITDILFLEGDGDIVSPEAIHSLEDIPVVIMAGGLGTRLYPYTKILPKPLIPIGDIPIIEHIMNSFYRYGAKRFILIVNHKKSMIKAYLGEGKYPYSIEYADEDKPLGTGGGLSLLKGRVDSTFILTNCDILIKDDYSKILKSHRLQGNVITMVTSAKDFKLPYGVVDLREDGAIKGIREKPSLSFLTNTGCYVAEPRVIEELENDTPIGFPDIINRYREAGERTGIYPVSEEAWYDMGQFDEMKRMEAALTGQESIDGRR